MQRAANDETINHLQEKCKNLQMDIEYHLKTIQDITQNISEHNNYIKELKDENERCWKAKCGCQKEW